MKYHSYSPTLAQLHGKKLSWTKDFRSKLTEEAIQLRSELTHSELQFSDRYGGISFSATMADDCKCARFKMIGYSHPERWLSTELEMTDTQEDLVFAKCCEMADIGKMVNYRTPLKNVLFMDMGKGCYHGPNALPYDLTAVSVSFITKWNIWHGSAKKVFCTEACFVALMEAWPEMLDFEVLRSTGKGDEVELLDIKRLNPDQLHPSLGDMIIRDFVRRQG
jgi:hypothetical protein